MFVTKGTVLTTPLRLVMSPVPEKREQTDMEKARRSSLVDEEICQRRVQELAVGASSSVPVSGARIN